MFQIDRSYIDHISLETLQGKIWDIRTDYKDDPTLPQIQHYRIESEEYFEKYLEERQHFEDFKESWRKRRLFIFGIAFAIPVAIFSLIFKQLSIATYGYAAGLLLCLLIYIIYWGIKVMREKKFRNNPCETFIQDLLSWEQSRSNQ